MARVEEARSYRAFILARAAATETDHVLEQHGLNWYSVRHEVRERLKKEGLN